MTIMELSRRGWSKSQIARTLSVTEAAVRYHLRRQADGAVDGRTNKTSLAEPWHDAICHWLEAQGGEQAPVNLAALHAYLVEEHDYPGSLRSVQRYFRRRFPQPRRRARRRVETPPGAQAQADWAEFPDMLVAGRRLDLHAFHLCLSHSRYGVIVWSERRHQLAWLHVHNEAFRRIEGVPAVVRIDNVKTAIARGAGAWGTVHASYRRYAEAVRFHVDACQPHSPEHKGKVERKILDQRLGADPRRRHWHSIEELQEWTDEQNNRRAHRRTCPATGSSVWEAWQAEKPYLGALEILPEPFDIAVMRRVGPDCMVAFEGRSYSVPFSLVGQRIEVRGCAHRVQFLSGGAVVAEHPRQTPERILIDPAHFEGEATAEVLPPLPLGRMGRRLAELAALAPEQRPLDLYAALAEVAR